MPKSPLRGHVHCDAGNDNGCRSRYDSLYPNLKGRWNRFIMRTLPPNPAAPFDQTKPPSLGQQAPLTPEYMAIIEANLAAGRW